MKRIVACLVLILGLSISASAQTGHGGTINFTRSSTAGTSTNVYSAPCPGTVTGTSQTNGGIINGTCSTPVGQLSFTLLANVSPNLSTYTDNSRDYGAKVVYRLTALCPSGGCSNGAAGESVPSAMVALQTPPAPPPPTPAIPQNPTITEVH